jgi:hypothetical protein
LLADDIFSRVFSLICCFISCKLTELEFLSHARLYKVMQIKNIDVITVPLNFLFSLYNLLHRRLYPPFGKLFTQTYLWFLALLQQSKIRAEKKKKAESQKKRKQKKYRPNRLHSEFLKKNMGQCISSVHTHVTSSRPAKMQSVINSLSSICIMPC